MVPIGADAAHTPEVFFGFAFAGSPGVRMPSLAAVTFLP